MGRNAKIAVIVVAGGSGRRAMRSEDAMPKQYQHVGGQAVLSHSINTFVENPNIDWVLPVIGAGHGGMFEELNLSHQKLLAPCFGGNERQDSSLNGLRCLISYQPDLVLIHDGARPIVRSELIERVCVALQSHGGALPVLPVTDTIKRSKDGHKILGTEDRARLWAAQTPQGFHYQQLLAAHQKATTHSEKFTDDAAVAEWADMDVVLVKGDEQTIKITNSQDFVKVEAILECKMKMETRVGSGMDIHQFEPGEMVRLGGVDIVHNAKLKGHSDADAALHVLTDALLGALADGDIGTHFPPDDEKWLGQPSDTFLSFAAEQVVSRGGRIVHLDLTINCEAPKIGPVAKEMQQNIAHICNISPNRVSVKATTSEQLGFVGRREGLMTLGTATIEVPRGDE